MSLPRLLLLTDRSQLPPGASLIGHLAACIDAGATHIVVRELDLAPSERAVIVEDLNRLGAAVQCARERVVGAAGLHQASTVRGPAQGLTGRSCHTADEVAIAAADGCDYVTLGPFATSESKPGYGPALPAIAYAARSIWTYALGGVTSANAEHAREAGADGVAVMGAVMRSTDPGALVADLLRRIS